MTSSWASGLWKGRGRWWRTGLALGALLLVLALVVVAALLTTVPEDESRTIAPEPSIGAPAPGLVAASESAPRPDPAVLARILNPLASSPAAGDLGASVIDDATGEVLWERDPGVAKSPASTTKLLTAVAALAALPADKRVDTVVAEGERPETLVVLPGGDPTMAAGGQSPLFPGAATLGQLADIVRGSGSSPREIVIAPGPYSGPELGPGWSGTDIEAGNIAPVQAWMLDSGRRDPADEYSPRTGTPMLDAGRALARELGLPPTSVQMSDQAPVVGRELGRVQSAPLTERLRSMLVHSDNVLAEAVCREVALARTPELGRADFAAGTAAVLAVLGERGIDTSGVRLGDCSGMSAANRISPAVLTAVLRQATAPDASRELRDLLDALPIAAATGTLADRYSGLAASGAGWVRAKTGTLTGVSALAGTVTDVDGRSMTFSLLSTGTNPADARPVLDRIASALRDCGCR